MQYLIFAISSALLFAFTFFLRKQAIRSLSISTAFLIETGIQFLLLLLVFIFLSPEFRREIPWKGAGVQFALMAGVTITLGVVLNYLALKGGFLSKVVSVTSPSQIIFGVILGLILLKEAISLRQIVGIVFAIIGIVIISL